MLKKVLPLMLLASAVQAAEVRVYNWTDYVAPDTLKNFEQASSIKVHYDVYDSNETLDAKLMAGRSGYDVVFPSNHFMARQIQGGAFKKLDRSRIEGWDNLNPQLLRALETNDPGNQYGIPYLWGTAGIGYNVDKVKAILGEDHVVDSWELLFNPEHLGKLAQCGVGILDNGPELIPMALHYLGLPHHSHNPDDYKKAEALLLEMRKNVRYFHSSKYVGDLANGEICLAVGFSGDIMQAASRAAEAGNGVKIDYVIPKEGAPMWFDMVTMPADAPNEAAGYAFMNYLLQPEVMAGISNHVHYANGNLKADALVDPALKADNKVYPPQEVMTKLYALEAMPLEPIEGGVQQRGGRDLAAREGVGGLGHGELGEGVRAHASRSLQALRAASKLAGSSSKTKPPLSFSSAAISPSKSFSPCRAAALGTEMPCQRRIESMRGRASFVSAMRMLLLRCDTGRRFPRLPAPTCRPRLPKTGRNIV